MATISIGFRTVYVAAVVWLCALFLAYRLITNRFAKDNIFLIRTQGNIDMRYTYDTTYIGKPKDNVFDVLNETFTQ